MSDVFTSDANPQTPAPVAQPVAALPLPDEVADLIGEGKKYADPITALKALKPSQEHIKRLEEENAALRARAQDADRVDEVYKAVQELQNQKQTPAVQSLDENAVASLVQRQLQEQRAREEAERNAANVREALSGAFGEKAKDAFFAKAQDLNMSVEELNAIARRSPKAALELFGLTPKPNGAPKQFTSTVNTEVLTHRAQPEFQKKPLMHGADTKDIIAALRHYKNEVLKENS